MPIRSFISSLRFKWRRGSVSRVEQVIDRSDIDPAKLARTVKAKFRQGEYTVTLRQGRYILVIPKPLSSKEINACRYKWEMIIDGRDIDPVKLANTVREKFGTGRFSITLSQDTYILKIPKLLSLGEIDGCRFTRAQN
ncbi:unnamed protein product [Clonostachys byssicola]|uniref:Uncharacterized protein n=1 Tax=Clonostachys byssicola TaxID=160290 RepID=A0A9N9UQX2_9HYPO|nr:unnamed protein product [Clonostachys byssicola]